MHYRSILICNGRLTFFIDTYRLIGLKADIGNISAKFGAINVIQNTLTTSVMKALNLVLMVGTLTVNSTYSHVQS